MKTRAAMEAAAERARELGIEPEHLVDFEAADRRSFENRIAYSFIRTYKPVLDDAPYRAFDSMAAYRRWCNEHLEYWLGYGSD